MMRGHLFGFLCVMIAASIVVYFASGMQSQEEWARETCRMFRGGCDSPWIVYVGTVVVFVLFLIARLTEKR